MTKISAAEMMKRIQDAGPYGAIHLEGTGWTPEEIGRLAFDMREHADKEALTETFYGEPAMTKDKLLDLAKAAVADRGLNYGSPEDNFGRIARLWQTHLRNRGQEDVVVGADDVAMMMALMKIARLENDPTHLDSWTDIAGYAACGATLPK